MHRKAFCLWSLIILLFVSIAPNSTSLKADPRPNFVIIVTDDQRYDTVGEYMPKTQAEIFDKGLTFSNAFITTSICCPSRASIFTGKYASNHGVRKNLIPLKGETVLSNLHSAGYATALIGKYLNSWPGGPKPEVDYWVSFSYGSSRYQNPELNVNGKWKVEKGYITYILKDHAVEFLGQAVNSGKPFLLFFTPNAPHYAASPDKVDEHMYAHLAPHRPPSFARLDIHGKPKWLQKRQPADRKWVRLVDGFRLRQLETLKSLDNAIESILTELARLGVSDNTVVMFISDNGFMWGEHRLMGKNYAYEESIRVPFAMRCPSIIPSPAVENGIVANIDIAPTIYDLAGFPTPGGVDGRSLVPLMREQRDGWRDEIKLEGWPNWRSSYVGVRTHDFKYIVTKGEKKGELYDLRIDPYELYNRVRDKDYEGVVADMQARLERLK